MEGRNNGGSELEEGSCSSEYGPIVFHSRKLMMKEIEEMMIDILHQEMDTPTAEQTSRSSVLKRDLLSVLRKIVEMMVNQILQCGIGPYMENFLRKVVRDEIQSAHERLLLDGGRNHEAETATVSSERILELKFLDEVSSPVLTGNEVRTREGKPIRLALVDKKTGKIINHGPESSSKVEILICNYDSESNRFSDGFNKRFAKRGTKTTKPHFSKPQYIDLREGEGLLDNAKLGHDSSWTKSCECKLVARLSGNIRGVHVQEACTGHFNVVDSRSKHREKGNPPSLIDPLWRLKNIGNSNRSGRIQRLHHNNIRTVKDFLFWLYVDPQRLQEIFTGKKTKSSETTSAEWNTTAEHAKTCIVNDSNIYIYFPSSESEIGVAYNAVGSLEGLIIKPHFVQVNKLSQYEKDNARNLLVSAFENPKDVTFFPDKTSLVKQFSDTSSDPSLECLLMSESLNTPNNSEDLFYYQSFKDDLENICNHRSPPPLHNSKEIVDSSSQPCSSASYSRFSVPVLVTLWTLRARKKVMDGVCVHKRRRIY